MGKRYDNILGTVGNTPVVRINKLGPKGINIFVKIESFNPMGSVKDRLALGVIEAAEKTGELKPRQTVVEATSGNTGIGLAMVCAQKGYPLVVTMAESFSVERRKLMRFLGAKVVLTPASEKGTGMVKKAEELAKEHGWWQSKQFDNPANADMHARTTAIEILDDFSDINLDYWVSGFGTGGTLNGVARVLKEKSPKTKIMVCEPDNSQLIGSDIAQARNDDGSHSQSHPSFRPHLMQGWTPDFISNLTEQAVAANYIDGLVPIDGNFALQCAKGLAQKEGIFVGITAGASLAGAIKIAETAPEGTNILCMLPDTGERYLSTMLFDGVATDMTQVEQALSRSTPNYRFDVAPNAVAPASTQAGPDKASTQEVDEIISGSKGEVLMFALEWCEFCWAIRKLFEEYGIPFKSVNLDSVEYLENNHGGKLRAALSHKTTWNTFPQIFIEGDFVGGAVDVFDGCVDGSIMDKLSAKKIPFNKNVKTEPYSFLPTWLHPR
ncbi:MAG: O-acetylserine lyase [Cycloclasticus sp. symbiont of Bathymodiolus heckerae]|nr:MAG: O-acetylserine lyase [Cycloclasticus sp. symbiont of Bathymodiolus heckerae]